MKKIQIRSLKDYDDRLTKGKVYDGKYNPGIDHPIVEFKCNQGMYTEVMYRSCTSNSSDAWFEIVRPKLNNLTRTV